MGFGNQLVRFVCKDFATAAVEAEAQKGHQAIKYFIYCATLHNKSRLGSIGKDLTLIIAGLSNVKQLYLPGATGFSFAKHDMVNGQFRVMPVGRKHKSRLKATLRPQLLMGLVGSL